MAGGMLAATESDAEGPASYKEAAQRPLTGAIETNVTSEGETQIGTLIATLIAHLLWMAFFPLSLLFIVKVVNEYTRVVILRLGRVLSGDARGPGLFFVLPCIDDLHMIDLRTQVFDIHPQEILTKDSVTVTVDAVLFFRIFHPVLSVTNVKNAEHSTRLLAQTTLRNVLGTFTLQQLITSRSEIATQMQTYLDKATDPWGVKVERVDIKDVTMPESLQRAMAAEAEASREAKAKVITAEGEKQASRALKEAANIMTRSKGAMQLRYLQTLQSVASEKNHTITFPLPTDLVDRFFSALSGRMPAGMPAGMPVEAVPLTS